MSKDLQVFNFNGSDLRIINHEDGSIWFVAKEVSDILDYSDAEAMTRKLDDDDITKANLREIGLHHNQLLINESGLYSAILSSKKEESKAFKKWVTCDVLPSIRKNGSYGDDKQTKKQLTYIDPEEKALNVLLLNIISKSGSYGINRTLIYRRSNEFTKTEVNRILKNLINSNEVIVDNVPGTCEVRYFLK